MSELTQYGAEYVIVQLTSCTPDQHCRESHDYNVSITKVFLLLLDIITVIRSKGMR